ncbi:MAG: hypothetical protein VXA26_12960 [Candidatus Neomarinimicrobiota bacterium]
MQLIYFLLLSIFLMPYSVQADLDLGDDFSSGATVSAAEFNQKFGKLKKVVGEIKDSDILGVWDCISYKETLDPQYADGSYLIENGGNGQVGNGYFFSNSGTITFTESDQQSSLNSPKNFTVSRADVLNDTGHDEGFYTLLLNKLHFFISSGGNLSFSNSFHIELFDENKLVFEPTSRSDNNYPNPNVVCNKST